MTFHQFSMAYFTTLVSQLDNAVLEGADLTALELGSGFLLLHCGCILFDDLVLLLDLLLQLFDAVF